MPIRHALQHATAHPIVHIVVRILALGALAWGIAHAPLNTALLGPLLVAGTVLVVRWPWFIWLGIAAALPVTSGVRLGPLSLTDVALAGAVWLWFADGVRRRQLQLSLAGLPLLLIAYLAVLSSSFVRAPNLAESAAEMIKWAEIFVAILLVRAMLSREQAHWLVAALLIGGAAQAVLGLIQFVFQIGPPWFIIFDRFMRASGSFRQPNPYAGYLGLSLPVALSLTLWAAERIRRRTAWFAFYGGATLLIGLGLLASWSRGGWLGATAGVGTVLLLYSRRFVGTSLLVLGFVLMIALLGGVSADMIPATMAQRLHDMPHLLNPGRLSAVLDAPVTNENFAVVERIAHWVAALRMWQDAPWFGVGLGNYAVVYPAVIRNDARLAFWDDPLGHAHNIYLNVLAESGLLGLLAYSALWFGIIVWVFRQYSATQYSATLSAHDAPPLQPIRRVPGHGEPGQKTLDDAASYWRALALGVLGVIMHLSIHNIFDNLFVQGMYLHIGLWLAVLHIQEPR